MYSRLCHSHVYLALHAYTDDGIPFGHSDVEIVNCLVSEFQKGSFFIKAMLFFTNFELHSTKLNHTLPRRF
jgi:hypothetical protein